MENRNDENFRVQEIIFCCCTTACVKTKNSSSTKAQEVQTRGIGQWMTFITYSLSLSRYVILIALTMS